MAVLKNPTELEVAEPFSSLFPISSSVLRTLTQRMRTDGYDAHHPILAWRDAFGDHGRTVVVDGHTRRQAAIDADVDSVMVTVRRFDSAEAAIAEAIDEQAHRRNLNSAQLAVYVLEALTRMDDGFRGQGARNDLAGRSARQLADMLGVGTSTIERARKLVDFGDSDLLAEVKRGDLSLKAAVERGRRTDAAEAPPVQAPREPEPDDEYETAPGTRKNPTTVEAAAEPALAQTRTVASPAPETPAPTSYAERFTAEERDILRALDCMTWAEGDGPALGDALVSDEDFETAAALLRKTWVTMQESRARIEALPEDSPLKELLVCPDCGESWGRAEPKAEVN